MVSFPPLTFKSWCSKIWIYAQLFLNPTNPPSWTYGTCSDWMLCNQLGVIISLVVVCIQLWDISKKAMTQKSCIRKELGGRCGKEWRKVRPFIVWVPGENNELPWSRKSGCNKVPRRKDHLCLKFKVLINPLPPPINMLNLCLFSRRVHFLPNT